jgi:tRNA threonylcarbamoyladenosine biosynthesis protein TsaE
MITRLLPDEPATRAFGRELGASARPGQIIALVGTLGAGKTTLASAITAGTGSDDPVTSPTFTLVHEYRGGHLPVFHLDFYRLESEHELTGLGWDDLLDANGLILVEWADLFPEALPRDSIWIDIDAPTHGIRSARVGTKSEWETWKAGTGQPRMDTNRRE